MKKSLFFLSALFLTSWVSAETFVFQYQAGSLWKALGTNRQTVYLNGELVNKTKMVTKIAYQITEVKDSKGLFDGQIQVTSEQAPEFGGIFDLRENYNVLYWRDPLGLYTMVKEDYMPVVRNVPTFPSKDLKPGDRWSAPGEEVHDMRKNFKIAKPMRIPMTVMYEFIGDRMKDGKTYKLIRIEYNINARTGYNYPGKLFPVLMSGWSRQNLYWDMEIGQPYAYEEAYSLALSLNNGNVFEFTGDADAVITEMPVMDRPDMVRSIKRDLLESGLGNLEVKPSDRGVTITLDNIQFEPESNILKPTEKAKLDMIGEILKKYPQRDILLEGHTALFGTKEGRQTLSEQRAAAVGNYLFSQGVRNQEQMLYKGFGAEKPIADNSTEAGMAKNRRVEITILEN